MTLIVEDLWRHLIDESKPGLFTRMARFFLRLLSLPYSVVMRVRNFAYDVGLFPSHRASIPVVCVGNLTVGGTGKTPMVEWIARYYREQNVRVTILSRGYGATDGPNDEALLLEENLPDVPHLQGPDRVALARIAHQEIESEVVVLDDGFQHRRLCRDLDILLVDARDPWGKGWMLPGGYLREPLSSLRRANVIILTRMDYVSADRRRELEAELQRRNPSAMIATARVAPTVLMREGDQPLPATELKSKRVLVFCGIASPDSLLGTLRSLGAEVVGIKVFRDHHAYTRKDVDELQQWARIHPADVVVTTQKDQVKLRLADLGGIPVRALRIETVIESGAEALQTLFVDIFSTRGGEKT